MIFARAISLKEDDMSQELAPIINRQTIERFQRDGAVHLAGVFDEWLAVLEVTYLIKKSVPSWSTNESFYADDRQFMDIPVIHP